MEAFDVLGISEEQYNAAEAVSMAPEYKPVPSGAYKATIKSMETYLTDKKAKMLRITVHLENENRDIEDYINLVKSEEKNNEPNELGQKQFKGLMAALNMSPKELQAKNGKFKVYGKEVEGHELTGFAGKQLIALVRQTYEEGSQYPDGNEIEGYLKIDGTDAKGENKLAEFKEKIERNPIKKKKARGGAQAKKSTTTTSSGSNLDDLL